MTEELISRQAAIEAIWDGINYDIYTREVKEIIEQLPAAVIRCGECKHTYLCDNFGITSPWLMCKRHIGNVYKVDEDDYCSWGERREDEADRC